MSIWFKNIRLFRLNEAFKFTPEVLNEMLSAHAFNPCGKLDLKRQGFVPPLGRHGELLVHAISGYIMVTLKRQEKILPSGIINEELDARVQKISEQVNRRVSRKERDGLKDEVIFELLPKAFVKNSVDYAYIAIEEQLIVVNTASAARAEELLSALREALGSLACVPVSAKSPASTILTAWLMDAPETGFVLGDDCELRGLKDDRIIRCKRQDLTAEEVLNHINSAMVVSKLSFEWQGNIAGVIDSDLSIKRIKFNEELINEASDYNCETAAAQFDVDFSIMTIELKAFISNFIRAFSIDECFEF